MTAPTDRGAPTTEVAATTTLVSPSFTPAVGSVFAVLTYWIGSNTTPRTFTVTDTFNDVGAWTSVERVSQVGASYSFVCEIFTAVAGASQSGSGTVTVTRSAGTITQFWFANTLELTGVNATPGLNASLAQTSATTIAVNLGSAPAATSVMIGMMGTDGDSAGSVATPPTSWTELRDLRSAASLVGGETAYRDGSGTQTTTWTGLDTASAFQVAIVAEFTASGGSPQTWDGSTGVVQVAATSGTFTPGTATWTGSTGSVTVTAVAGSFTAGTAVWSGSAGTVTVTAVSGSFIAGAATWAGSAGTVTVTAVSGQFSTGGSPQTWNGSTGTVTVTATSGSFVAGTATWTGSTGTVNVTAGSGVFTAGTATWVGSSSTVALNGISGVFLAGPATWAGSVGTITVTATSGYFIDTALIVVIVGPLTTSNVPHARTTTAVRHERTTIEGPA